MGKVYDWAREFLEKFFEWIEEKNLTILFAFLLMIILGILAQIGLIPKLIS